MATFDFSRMAVAVNQDDIVANYFNYATWMQISQLSVTVHKKAEFDIKLGVNTVQFLGKNFKYDAHNLPTAGTIDDVHTFYKGHVNLTFDIYDLNLKISALKSPIGLAGKIFKGDDTFLGGKVGDKLYGYKGDDAMSGRAGADSLDGGAGMDTLNGGKGVDVLTGGAAADSFLFDNSPTHGVDTIVDFSVEDGDKIQLDKDIFNRLGGVGTLADSKFVIEHGTHTKHPQGAIIYDDVNGDLYWARAQKVSLIAHLDDAPTLTHANIELIA